MEAVVNKCEELKEQLKLLGSDSYEKEIKNLKEEIEYNERQIRNALEHIQTYSKRKRVHVLQMIAYKKKNKEERDFTSDIEAILSHPTVIDMKVDMKNDNKIIYIYTDYVDIYDGDGNRFRGNKYKVEFNFNNMSVKFFGEDSDYNRESCWGENCPHPHVSNEGNPCLGDAGSMIAMNMNEYELYASYIIALNFLQQVNINDGAGEYIYNWDCIDDDDNIIENPYEKQYVRCSECDERIHEDDVTHCEECGVNLCGDHYYYIKGDCLCESCRDEFYTYCQGCDEWHLDEDVTKAEDGNMYCDNCLCNNFTQCDDCEEWVEEVTEVDDKRYCNDCLDDNASKCENCGELHKDEDLKECDECGKYFCDSCFDTSKDMCNECVLNNEDESEDK